ncbi:hypothetical protein BH24BAC1_BH24BAC1_31630 [soil metagenome]
MMKAIGGIEFPLYDMQFPQYHRGEFYSPSHWALVISPPAVIANASEGEDPDECRGNPPAMKQRSFAS